MRPARIFVAVVAAAAAIVATFAIAAGGMIRTPVDDRSAATAYLRARMTLLHALVAELPASAAPVSAFVAHVASECGGSLRGAPANAMEKGVKAGLTDEELLLLDGFDDIAAAQRSVDAAVVETFARSVGRLRWRDHRVTALVRALAEIETERLKVRPPDVCSQIKAWAVSGYRLLPQATLTGPSEPGGQALARELAALGCGPVDLPEDAVVVVMRQYHRAGGQPTTRQVELAEYRWNVAAAIRSTPEDVALERTLGARLSPKRPERRRTHGTNDKAPAPYELCTGQPEGMFERVGGADD